MVSKRVIVLSDLHLGPVGPLATFREGATLAALLRVLRADPTPVLEIVLAGDVFDFLQTPGYAGFDAAKAPDRLGEILRGPETAPVVAAMGELAGREGIEITVLAGNHDPEMLLPLVREAFEKAIGREGSVRWADDEPLRPRDGDDVPVWGRAVGDEHGQVWIVHGDRWDPHNVIERDRLREAIAAGQSVELPVGSQLVYDVLQKLQVDHRWIPELKPELSVVVPLLLYLDPLQTMKFLRSHFKLSLELLGGAVATKLRLGDLFGEEPGGDSSTSATPPAPADLPDELASLIAGALPKQLAGDPERAESELVEWLSKGDAGQTPVADGVLAAHTGARRALLRAWLRAVRAVERRADPNGDDGMARAARRFLPAGLAAFVAGHTHGPRSRVHEGVRYFNTGTWIPVGKLHEGDIEKVIDDVEAGRWEANAPRSFVVIDIGDGPPDVSLAVAERDGTWKRVDGHG